MAGTLIALAAGIAVGHCPELPLTLLAIGAVLFVLLFLTLLLRKADRVSTLLLLLSVFMLGVLLISRADRADGGSKASVPVLESVGETMSRARTAMLGKYRDLGLTGDEYGVVAAMTLGERTWVSNDVRHAYNVAGTAHVFALSGMHLAIVFGIVSLLLPVRIFPRASAIVQMLLIWTFVMLVGIRPSILRAAVMFTSYALCRMLSRNSKGLDVLIFAALLLLAVFPQWLFDVGFQMSFMAMFGIMLLNKNLMSPLVRPRWAYRDIAGIMAWEVIYVSCGWVVMTVSATLGTLPLLAYYFGRVPCYGLRANLVASPCATVILFLTVVLLALAALQSVFAPLSALSLLTAMLLKHVVAFMNHAVEWVASLPGASVEGIRLSIPQVLLLYVIIYAAINVVYHASRMAGRRLTGR